MASTRSQKKAKCRVRAGGRWYLSTLQLEEIEKIMDANTRQRLRVVTEKEGHRAGILTTHVSVWEELGEDGG